MSVEVLELVNIIILLILLLVQCINLATSSLYFELWTVSKCVCVQEGGGCGHI